MKPENIEKLKNTLTNIFANNGGLSIYLTPDTMGSERVSGCMDSDTCVGDGLTIFLKEGWLDRKEYEEVWRDGINPENPEVVGYIRDFLSAMVIMQLADIAKDEGWADF